MERGYEGAERVDCVWRTEGEDGREQEAVPTAAEGWEQSNKQLYDFFTTKRLFYIPSTHCFC